MRTRRLSYLLVLFTLVPVAALARQAAPAATATPAAVSARIWEGHNAEFEEFMRTTPFTRIEEVPIGVTKPKRGYFEAGGLVVSAAWKVLPPGRPHGYWESYKSEIAAYELDKLLEMNMVPPVVEKRWKGDLGAAVLWLKPIRPWKEVEPLPKPEKWNRQAVRMKMFDNLIGNPDRNAGNLLVDGDWNLYLIDHSRAFISDKKLPVIMARIDKELWDRMRALDEPSLDVALGKWVDRGERRAILARRDKMQAWIDTELKKKNESLVYIK
ncbi:hypothetical protein BH18ACI5_BH18ACI5_12800 [soil metagenome]